MAEQDFERAFASLAYAELEQRVPGLFPYLIGFQLIEKNDDDTHAVGIFGFKVGKGWYYTPVFWLNGRLKGFDLLYINAQDLFVPLQESWVNYIINRQPQVFGEAAPGKPSDMGVGSPDLSVFRDSPLGKSAADDTMQIAQLVKQASRPLPLIPSFGAHGVLDWVRQAPVKYAHCLLNTMQVNEKFAEAVLTMYTPDEVLDAINDAAVRHTLLSEKTAAKSPRTWISSSKPGKVLVIHGEVGQDGVDSFTPLSTDEQEALMSDNVVIRDNRDDDSKSEVYAAPQYEKTFQTPDSAGLYRVLMFDGSLTTVFYTPAPVGIGDMTPDSCGPKALVLDAKEKRWAGVSSQKVLARAQLDGTLWDKEFKALPAAESLSVGDAAVLVAADRKMTVPFCVKEVTKGTKGEVTYRVQATPYDFNLTSKPTDGGWAYDGDDSIVLMDNISGIRGIRNTLTAGKGTLKAVKLGNVHVQESPAEAPVRGAQYKTPAKLGWYDFRRTRALKLGTIDTLDALIRDSGLRKLSMVYDGNSEVSIKFGSDKRPRMSKANALAYLVKDAGLSVPMAQTLLKQARITENQKVEALVKQAISLDTQIPSYDSTYGVPVQRGGETNTEEITSETENDGTLREDILNPVDQEAQQQAMRAAQSGQKDVFDTALLTGLVRSGRVDAHVENFTKDIIVGNDRIGRTLFLFYWNFSEFADRYGEEDMAELEDLLRETFKSVGDLVLFLKQKSIESSDVASGAVLDI